MTKESNSFTNKKNANHITSKYRLLQQIQPNQKFGKWTTTDKWHQRGSRWFVNCICECGIEKAVYSYSLIRKTSLQCPSCRVSSQNKTHGQNCAENITYEYRNWINLNHKKLLGEEWSKSFETFFQDTGKRPHEGYLLLRKSNSNPHNFSNSYWGHPKLRFFKDLEGKQFGDWKVLEKILNKPRIFWLCQCKCGRKDRIAQDQLINGKSTKCKSCAAPKPKTHGYSRDLIYLTYYNMKRRCYSKKSHDYIHYGARGIKMCQRWIDSFENFVEDMGKRPQGYSIDRIDVNGDYSPENCRWATQKEQVANRRKTEELQNEINELKEKLRSYEDIIK